MIKTENIRAGVKLDRQHALLLYEALTDYALFVPNGVGGNRNAIRLLRAAFAESMACPDQCWLMIVDRSEVES